MPLGRPCRTLGTTRRASGPLKEQRQRVRQMGGESRAESRRNSISRGRMTKRTMNADLKKGEGGDWEQASQFASAVGGVAIETWVISRET